MSQQVAFNGNSSVIPLIEVYWSLVNKADKKFSKIRDLPYYERNRYETYFFKVFKVYTQLWKFQQENRQKLVEAGVKRWEIGEIASRIAQLYYGQYMRTSDSSYLSESYIFYEAILTREYFKEGLFQDINIANKQLRFLARFLMVCLVLNRREMLHQLVDQLKLLIDECKRAFQETDFKEWKLVVQEIVRFLKADSTFGDIRPLRYSLVLDPHPDTMPHVSKLVANRSLKLRDAILSTYHYNEVKYSELTLDAFRMLQCLEWEPSGSFYQSTNAKIVQNGGMGAGRNNYPQNITDPTLPPNPRKVVLYRPSVTNFLAVLATVCEELPADGILLVYLSASGRVGQFKSPPSTGRSTFYTEESLLRDFHTHSISEDEAATSPIGSQTDRSSPLEQNKGDPRSNHSNFLYFGSRGNSPSCIYPCDLIPFTRRPLFIIVDSDSSEAFKAISGAEKGDPAALLLSPSCPPLLAVGDSCRHSSGSLFTMFLTAPLQAFSLLIGISFSDLNMDIYNEADKLLTTLLNGWGLSLASSEALHPVWAQSLRDPFLRRLLLRFMFCRVVLALYFPTNSQREYQPECLPPLPEPFSPTAPSSQSVVSQIASIFDATSKFAFSGEETTA